MTTAIKRRRGTTAQHSTFTGLEGELTVDTTKDTVVVHDGATAGGFPLAKESQATSAVAITGGSINGTTIGASTASTGAFTTLSATGVTTVQAGTVSAPAITTTGDTNTGIFFPAADTIAFTEGGVEAMRITDTGRVGIGTSSPNFKLENTTAADIGNNAIYSTTAYAFGRSATPCYITAFRESFSTNSSIVFHSNNNEGTAPSEKMRLTSSGNLGLGVTPSAWSSLKGFDIVGGAGFAGGFNTTYISSNSFFNGSNWIYKATATAGYSEVGSSFKWFNAPSGTAGNAITFTQAMTLDASGNLLLGQTTSAYSSAGRGLISINGTSEAFVGFNTGGNFKGYIGHDGTNFTQENQTASGYIRWATNSTERMRIDSSGRLGLGTTPSAWGSNFNVEDMGSFGGLAINNITNNFHIALNSYNDNTNWKFKTANASLRYTLQNDQHEWYYSASGSANSNITYTQVMLLTSGGNLTISGATATKASGTTWSNPSDVRLKENISSFTKGLAELQQVNVKTWDYNGKAGTTAGTKGLGVIADEIMQVLPNTVDTYKAKLNANDEVETDIKRFDATEITWLLVNSVKELKATVDAQAARIAALESK
jgi:hypothetical protein